MPCSSNELIRDYFTYDNYDLEKTIFNLQKEFDDFYLGIELYSNDDKVIMEKVRKFAINHSYKKIAFPKHLYEKKK